MITHMSGATDDSTQGNLELPVMSPNIVQPAKCMTWASDQTL